MCSLCRMNMVGPCVCGRVIPRSWGCSNQCLPAKLLQQSLVCFVDKVGKCCAACEALVNSAANGHLFGPGCIPYMALGATLTRVVVCDWADHLSGWQVCSCQTHEGFYSAHPTALWAHAVSQKHNAHVGNLSCDWDWIWGSRGGAWPRHW
jgi:hypothetical protein